MVYLRKDYSNLKRIKFNKILPLIIIALIITLFFGVTSSLFSVEEAHALVGGGLDCDGDLLVDTAPSVLTVRVRQKDPTARRLLLLRAEPEMVITTKLSTTSA